MLKKQESGHTYYTGSGTKGVTFIKNISVAIPPIEARAHWTVSQQLASI